jgi:hypothetical protein
MPDLGLAWADAFHSSTTPLPVPGVTAELWQLMHIADVSSGFCFARSGPPTEDEPQPARTAMAEASNKETAIRFIRILLQVCLSLGQGFSASLTI